VLAARLGPVLARRRRVALAGADRLAGVLVLLYDHDGGPHLVLTKRTETVAHHRGEVSLPGGRFEPGDGDLLTTALRETEEEIGVPAHAVEVVGPLDDVHSPASHFTVSPWVGTLTERPALVPAADEIARVIEVALADVLAADLGIPPIPDRATLRYPLHGEDVWGLTARILHTLAAATRAALAESGPG
jgi:8-oxo-dGTP pyrophosphatase MutT (NUDIX family)